MLHISEVLKTTLKRLQGIWDKSDETLTVETLDGCRLEVLRRQVIQAREAGLLNGRTRFIRLNGTRMRFEKLGL